MRTPNPETYAARLRREHLECLRLFVRDLGGDSDALTIGDIDKNRPFKEQFAAAEQVEIDRGYEAARPLYEAYHRRVKALLSTRELDIFESVLRSEIEKRDQLAVA